MNRAFLISTSIHKPNYVLIGRNIYSKEITLKQLFKRWHGEVEKLVSI